VEGCEDVGFGGMSGAFCFNCYDIMLVVSGKRGEHSCIPMLDNLLNSSMLRPKKPFAERLGVTLIMDLSQGGEGVNGVEL
jgi:hypothetical protein